MAKEYSQFICTKVENAPANCPVYDFSYKTQPKTIITQRSKRKPGVDLLIGATVGNTKILGESAYCAEMKRLVLVCECDCGFYFLQHTASLLKDIAEDIKLDCPVCRRYPSHKIRRTFRGESLEKLEKRFAFATGKAVLEADSLDSANLILSEIREAKQTYRIQDAFSVAQKYAYGTK